MDDARHLARPQALFSILHAKLRQLIEAGKWDHAAVIGENAINLAEHTPPAELATFADLSTTLAQLGMVISPLSRNRLRHTLERVLSSSCSSGMPSAVEALRTLHACNLSAFIASLPQASETSVCKPSRTRPYATR
jgi:hypothetical protein